MLTKTAILLAMAFTLGIASVALAANENDTPAFHKAAAAKCAKLKSYDPSDMTFLGKDGKRHPCPG
jgi:hypothetical protein